VRAVGLLALMSYTKINLSPFRV